jgi:putative FmdB family regulatory protein
MPVYEYRCKKCGTTHEIEHGVNAERPTSCPKCGGQLVRVFHPVGVVFKGTGFHKTDYTSSGVRKEPAPAGSSSENAKSATPSDGKSETKTAAKPEGAPPAASKPASAGDTKPSSGSPKT